MQTQKNFLIVLAGPTAVGKTTTAILLAKHFNTEIISADSRQFYRELKIGTAAPSFNELQQAKHHFIHHLSIHQKYDVADFERDTIPLLANLFQKKKTVILTGGSGLYIDAVCNGIDKMPEIDQHVRRQVHTIYTEEGLEGLQNLIQKIDPEYFKTVDQLNPRRLQRALEVFFQTGNTFSSFRINNRPQRFFTPVYLGLERPRGELIGRINARTEQMMTDGLLDEVQNLLPYQQLNALQTVGYKELFGYLNGLYSLEEAIEKIKVSTRQYAKRQMTWFRKNQDYRWFHPRDTDSIIEFAAQKTE